MDAAKLCALLKTMDGWSPQADAAAVRAWLRETVTFVSPTEVMVTGRTVMARYPDGPGAGAAVLEKLETAAAAVPAVRWAMYYIKGDGIDIASPATRGQIDALVAGTILTLEEAEALKSLGEISCTRWASVGGADGAADQVIDQAVDAVRGW